jgi:hypothetical protein
LSSFFVSTNNGQSKDTGNIEHKKANKNAINNAQSRDTGNIEHKKANKNATNNGQSGCILVGFLVLNVACVSRLSIIDCILVRFLGLNVACVSRLFIIDCILVRFLVESEQECNQ